MSAAAAASPAEKAPAAAPGPTASSANAAIENGLIQDGLFERCLEPLLRAAGWRGQTRQIVEAMPHLEQLQSVNELRLVLHRLGYRSTSDLVRADEILDERLPAVTLHDGAPRVLLARAASGELLVFDSETQETAWAAPPRGGVRLYRVYSPLDGDAASEAEADHEWLRNAFFSVGGDASVAGLLTLFANILALAAPLATMVVFNVILPSEGVLTLGFLAMIAIGALYLENRLRRKRSEILSSAAARVNCAILVKSFGRILALPAAMVEAASVTAQVTRMRQFESILGAFSGAVMGAVFDLPFIIVFLLAIFLLGGPLVLIPIVAVVLFALMGLLISPASHRANRKAAMSKERAQSLTFEMITNLDTIQSLAAPRPDAGARSSPHRGF
ncbi:MAG: ABC transporter transmembrane domain-containing protein, partial [Pseudomonadota bacterium]